MSERIVPIRSVKQYIREFIYEGIIQKGMKPEMVKEQLLDAFQKEVFGQIVLKYHDAAILSRAENMVDPAVREGCRHILENANRKWKRLCMETAGFGKTRMLLDQDDLMKRLQDIVEIQENERKDA